MVIIGAPIVAVLWGIGWATRTVGLPMEVMVPVGLVVGFGLLAAAMAVSGYYAIDW